MKTFFLRICSLLLTVGVCSAQGVFEAPITASFGGTGGLFAGMGYFRVTGTTVEYHLAVLGGAAGSLSPVFATASFETIFTTGIGEVITVSGCRLHPPNPFLPLPEPPGPITCPAQATWGDYWGSFELPLAQAEELFSGGGSLRIPFGWPSEIQGPITQVPEPSSLALLAPGLLWLLQSKRRNRARQTDSSLGVD